MLFPSKFILSFAIALAFSGTAFVVHGQDMDTDMDVAPTSATSAAGTSSIDPCLQACILQAATDAGCSDTTDTDCICSSEAFQSSTSACLENQCAPSVASQAQVLQSQQCAGVSGDGQSSSATSGPSRNLAPSGASTRTSTGGSVYHSTTSVTGSAAVPSPSGGESSLATAGSDKMVNMNKVIGFGAVTVGLILGALAVW